MSSLPHVLQDTLGCACGPLTIRFEHRDCLRCERIAGYGCGRSGTPDGTPFAGDVAPCVEFLRTMSIWRVPPCAATWASVSC